MSNEVYKEFEARQKKLAEEFTAKITALKPKIFAAMRACGVTEIEVSYSGEGDSGAIGDIEASTSQGVVDCRVDLGEGMDEKFFEQLAWDIIEHAYPCFEDGEGASGTVVFGLADEFIRIKHEEYIRDSLHSERAW